MDDRALASAFGTRLRAVRNDRGLKQDDVAKAAGLSRTSVVNIEAGRQGVALGTLFRLAEALGVAPAELLPEVADANPMPSIAIGAGAMDSEEILRSAMSQLGNRESE